MAYDPDAIIGRVDAAKLLGLTERRVSQLVDEGALKKDARGRYKLSEVVAGYIGYLKDEGRRTSKSAAESRVRDRKADLIEVQMMERTGSLLREARQEALSIVDDVIGGFRTDLMAVPARVTSDLEVRRKIEAAHDHCFREAAKRASDRANGISAGDEPADTSGEDDA